MALSEYEHDVLRQMEQDLLTTGRTRRSRVLALLSQVWPLLVCTGAVAVWCVCVVIVAPPVLDIASVAAAAFGLGLMWGNQYGRRRCTAEQNRTR